MNNSVACFSVTCFFFGLFLHLCVTLSSTSDYLYHAFTSHFTEKDPVTAVEFVSLSSVSSSSDLLVVISLGGAVFVYEENGQKCLATYKINKKCE